MELTPQQIDAARTAAEVERQARLATWHRRWDHHEKRALREHPPVFRTTQPVPAAVRQAETKIVGDEVTSRPPPIRKRHVLP